MTDQNPTPPAERERLPAELIQTAREHSSDPDLTEYSLRVGAFAHPDWRYEPDFEVQVYRNILTDIPDDVIGQDGRQHIIQTAEDIFEERDSSVIYVEDTPVDLFQVYNDATEPDLSEGDYLGDKDDRDIIDEYADTMRDVDLGDLYETEADDLDGYDTGDITLEESVTELKEQARQYAEKHGRDPDTFSDQLVTAFLTNWKKDALQEDDTATESGGLQLFRPPDDY